MCPDSSLNFFNATFRQCRHLRLFVPSREVDSAADEQHGSAGRQDDRRRTGCRGGHADDGERGSTGGNGELWCHDGLLLRVLCLLGRCALRRSAYFG